MPFAPPGPVRLLIGLALLCLLPAGAAAPTGPFASAPPPQPAAAAARATDASDYRSAAARHVYASYPERVLRGKVRANVYAVVVTETDVDAQGKVLAVRVLRQPSHAPEVAPWVVKLLRSAAPFPAPAAARRARYVETWLVDASGQFQVHTLTEGQL
jgi:outer membrane biosynthesis protein TonB